MSPEVVDNPWVGVDGRRARSACAVVRQADGIGRQAAIQANHPGSAPAAHAGLAAICSSRQRLTLSAWFRQISIILSMVLVERTIRATVGARRAAGRSRSPPGPRAGWQPRLGQQFRRVPETRILCQQAILHFGDHAQHSQICPAQFPLGRNEVLPQLGRSNDRQLVRCRGHGTNMADHIDNFRANRI